MAQQVGTQGEQAAQGIAAVDAVDLVADVGIVLGAVIAERVGTDGGEHAPGGQLDAVKGQGHHQAGHIHVVHEILLVAVGIAHIVVVVRTGPESRHGSVFIENVAGGDGGHVRLEDGGAAHGHVGQTDALDTHAQFEVRIGHAPVDEGSLELHDILVGAHGHAALRILGLAPDGLADFKVDLTGKVFVSHGVDDQTDTGTGFEFVFARVIAGMSAIGEVTVLTILETRQPYPLGFEVYSVACLGGSRHHGCCQQQAPNLFHNPSSRETVVFGQSPETWVQKQTRRRKRRPRGSGAILKRADHAIRPFHHARLA